MAKYITDLSQRKFALLTDQMYKALKDGERAKQLTESTEFQTARTLDGEIEKLLANKSLPAVVKAQKYAQLVKQFQAFRSRAPEIQKEPEPLLQPSRRNIPEKAEWKDMTDYYIEDEPMQYEPDEISHVSSVGSPNNIANAEYINSHLRSPQFHEQRSVRSPSPASEEQDPPFSEATSPVVARSSRASSPRLDPYRTVYDEADEFPEPPYEPLQFAAVSSPVVETSNEKRQERVDNLKEQLKQAPPDILSFDKNTRQLMVFGHKMPGSNIDKILTYVSNHRPPAKEKPQDVGTFLETYGAANLDVNAIPNKQLRQIAAAAVPRGHGKRILRWKRLYS